MIPEVEGERVSLDFPVGRIQTPGGFVAGTHPAPQRTLAAKGDVIGAHDLWLAATCVSRGLTQATGNARDFRRVPGLALQVWGPDLDGG